MIVKQRLNDTNYMLQKSAKNRPFVIHVDHMRQFPNELSKEKGLSDPHKVPTSADSSLQPLNLKPSTNA